MSPIRIAAFAATAVLALAMPAAAQRAPIQTTKVEGTDNVYIFRNVGHQAMFVVTPAGVIATDPVAYGKPDGGRQYLEEIRKVTDKPVKYVVLTHYHAVRVLGASGYKAEHVIASRPTYEMIKERGAQDWKSEVGRFPRLFRAAGTVPLATHAARFAPK